MNTRHIALTLLLVATPAASFDVLTDEDVREVASTMADYYRSGGVRAMLAAENRCWTAASKDIRPSFRATCMAAAMSGAIIEATVARAQGRGPLPQYDPKKVRARMLAKAASMGLPQKEVDEIIAESVSPRISEVIAGLVASGIR